MVKKKSVKKRPNIKTANKFKQRLGASQKRTNLVIKNLVLFVILSILCLFFRSFSSNEEYTYFFSLFATIFGFIGLAFLIVLLILVFSRILRK